MMSVPAQSSGIVLLEEVCQRFGDCTIIFDEFPVVASKSKKAFQLFDCHRLGPRSDGFNFF